MNEVEQKYEEHITKQDQLAKKLSMLAFMPPEKRKALLKKYGSSEEKIFGQQEELGQQIEPEGQGVVSDTPIIDKALKYVEDNPSILLTGLFLATNPVGTLAGLGLEKTSVYVAKHVGAGEFTQELVGLAANVIGFALGEGSPGEALRKAIPGAEGEAIAKEVEEFVSKNEELVNKLKEAIKPPKGEELAKLTPELEATLAKEGLSEQAVSGHKLVDDQALRDITPGLINKKTAERLASAQKVRLNRLNKLVDIYAGATDEERALLHPKIVDEFTKYSQLMTHEVVETVKGGKTIYTVAKTAIDEQILGKEALKEEFPAILHDILKRSEVSERMKKFTLAMNVSRKLHAAQVAALLWEPGLWIKKAMTDFMHLPLQKFAQSVGVIPQVGLTEAAKLFASAIHAMIESIPDAARIFGRTLEEGEPVFERALGKKQAQVFMMDDWDETVPGMANTLLATIWTLGERAIMSIDQASKVLSRAGEIRFQAMYKALGEVDGTLVGAERWTHAEELAADYVGKMENWLVEAADKAMYKDTMTNKNALSEGAKKLAEVPGLRNILVFTGTPVNLVARSLDWIPGKGLYDAYTTKGLERSTALAKQALGALFVGWVWRETQKGNIMGSGPTFADRETRASWKSEHAEDPNTMWGHRYRDIPALGKFINLVADIAEYYDEGDPDSKLRIPNAVIKAAGNFAGNVPFTFSMSQWIDTVRAAKRGGDTAWDAAGEFIANQLETYVPELLKLEGEMEDPVYYDARGLVDEFTKDIPKWVPVVGGKTPSALYWDGKTQFLPPGSNQDNTPPDRWSVLMNKLNPIGEGEHRKLDDADKAFAETGFIPPRIPYHVGSGSAIVPITEEQRHEWGVAQGELKIGNMGTIRESLNNAVNSQAYKDMPTKEAKKDLIKQKFHLYRERAKEEVGKKYDWSGQIKQKKLEAIKGAKASVQFEDIIPTQPLPGTTPTVKLGE